MSVKPKIMYFTGISRARFLKFHAVFIETSTNRAARTLESRTSSVTGMHAGLSPTRAVLLSARSHYFLYDKVFPGLDFGHWDD